MRKDSNTGSSESTGTLVTSGRVAKLLGVSQSTVHNMVQRGDLPFAQKIDGQVGSYLFDETDVRALAAERRADLEAKLARMQGAAS